MKALQNIKAHENKIAKLKQQLLDFEVNRQNDISWSDIISQCDPRQGMAKWKEANKKIETDRRKIEDLLLHHTNEFKLLKLQEINEIKFKFYCSICLIIRDENEYLEEWLNWHIEQGVEYFYIYDHGSKKPVAEFIKKLDRKIQDKILIIDWSGEHKEAQHEAYNDCLKKNAYQSRWIGFIDSDEMVRVKNGDSIPKFLKEYEDFAGVMTSWILYGAGGQEKKCNLPVRERFTRVSPCDIQLSLGKVFVQPLLMKKMVIHNGYTIDGFNVVDEHKTPLQEAALGTNCRTTKFICIDHYFTKSHEEWVEKMKRGSCDPYYNRKYHEFFLYNPDMKHCMHSTYPTQEYEVSKK